jgi:5,10-methylenetetrahydromethanopterin reductase
VTGRPRFGLRIPPCRPLTEVAACVRDAEDAGFDVAWLPDSQFLWRDVWGGMTLAAAQTSSIALGTCVTNLETRHPSVTAAAAAGVAELAPGRVVLGLGSGDSAVKTLGLKPTGLARMREQIELLRALLAGEPADFGGRSLAVKAAGPAVPIYLAATGPKMQALAGELADGVIVVTGLEPDLVRATLARIGAGAARAGRRVEELDVCFGTYAHVASDRREAARIAKPYVVATAQTGGQALLHELGIHIDPPELVGGIYPDMSHAEDWDAAAEAAAEWVSDEQALRFGDAFCLIGSPDELARRLAAAAEAGARSFYIRHFSSYTLPSELLGTFAEAVLPRFGGGGS